MTGGGAVPWVVGVLLGLAVLVLGRSESGIPPGVPQLAGSGRRGRRWRSQPRWSASWPWGARARDRRRAVLAAQTSEALDLCVAGLRAGLDLPSVLAFAAREVEAPAEVIKVLRGDVEARHAVPVAEVVAQARELSLACGVPLADAWASAAGLLREEETLRRKVAVALAGPRATMRLLTVLPIAGPVVGLVFGIDPVRLYLGSPVAGGCLVLGLLLLALGRWWCARLLGRLGLGGLA